MVRAWVLLFCLASLLSAVQTPGAADVEAERILTRARENILQQLKQATNYTCTEVLDRNYFFDVDDHNGGCGGTREEAYRRPYMHDRLRLDVAVSSNGEIFSWHGGREFSSAGVEAVVKHGAISSGAFVGYLRNIFERPNVLASYAGTAVGPAGTATFFYDVPLASSGQEIEVRGAQVRVPFHGSFTVDVHTLQLVGLDVTIDRVPPQSEICSASMKIHYQMVRISGRPSLIPKTYLMELGLVGDESSSSRTDFTDCRAFGGESVVHYSDVDHPESSKAQIGPEEALPAHIKLRAALITRIDNATSFTGDRIEASLLKPVEIAGLNVRLPKGARLSGIISRLESYYLPVPPYRVGIHLDAIVDGAKTYRMNAFLQTPYSSKSTLMSVYGSRYREMAPKQASGGEFLFLGRSFHTSRDTAGTWVTRRTEGE